MNAEKVRELLLDYLMNNTPSDLDELSTHTSIEDVADVAISSTVANGAEVNITGTATVEVELAYGSDREREDEDASDEQFEFTFDIVVEGEAIKSANLEFDTSSFYN